MSRDRKGASRRGNRPAIIRGELHPSGRVASHRAPRGPFNPMADKIIVPDINSWLEDELRAQYHHDRRAVDESWKDVFESGGNGAPPASQMIPAAPPSAPISKQIAAAAVAVGPTEQLAPLRGAAARIAVNMAASLDVPTATSQRVIPVKVMEENRRIINQHRTLVGKSKISYSHLIGYAMLQALETYPSLNDAFVEKDGELFRVVRRSVNLGIAVDVTSGSNRSLLVPSIKDAGKLDFAQYQAAFDDVVARA